MIQIHEISGSPTRNALAFEMTGKRREPEEGDMHLAKFECVMYVS